MVVTHFLCTLFDWVVYFFSSSCGKETGGRLDLGIPVSALQSILACSLDLIITWPPRLSTSIHAVVIGYIHAAFHNPHELEGSDLRGSG